MGLAFVLMCAAVGSAKAVDACSLLTDAQVSAAIGQAQAGKHMVPSSDAICVWNGEGGKRVTLTIYTQVGSRSPMDRFNTAKTDVPGVTKTPVSGVGDEAFYSEARSLTVLVVRKGNTPFNVEMRGFPVEQLKEKEKELAVELVRKL